MEAVRRQEVSEMRWRRAEQYAYVCKGRYSTLSVSILAMASNFGPVVISQAGAASVQLAGIGGPVDYVPSAFGM